MKPKKMLELIKSGSITIPLYFMPIKKEMNIDSDAFLILMYLVNQKQDPLIFDASKIGHDMNFDLSEVMGFIDLLSSKKLLSVDVIKNGQEKMEEIINLDLFYEKVNNLLIDEVNREEKDTTTIYSKFESEFGRCLSSMEYEIIHAWIDSKISEELILEALKEAIMNGVTNLRYIDKILYEWGKKGYKTKEDVDKSRQDFRRKKEEKQQKKEVFDYNWLEDDENE